MAITFSGKTLYQSKYIYLQAAGSTGNDGSLEGIHLRWELLDSLGDKHIPKGNMEQTSQEGFNKPDDYVKIYRSKYVKKYPITIDLTKTKPSKVKEISIPILDKLTERKWIFKPDSIQSNDTVYFDFLDIDAYDAVKNIDAKNDPIAFIKAYGDGLIKISVDKKLCFATEIFVDGFGANPTLKVEAISKSVEDGKVISCRKKFGAGELGLTTPSEAFLAQENDSLILQENLFRIYLEESPVINNLFENGTFENSNIDFETEYISPITNQNGQIQIINNAQIINSEWSGAPIDGSNFLAVSGSTIIDKVIWKHDSVAVDSNTSYTFSGWLANLLECDPVELPEIEIRITGKQTGTTKSIQYKAPVMQGKWLYLESLWSSGSNTSVCVEIVNKSTSADGNRFGLDNLRFVKSKIQDYGRVVAENIQYVRFKTSDCSLYKINIETYDKYISAVNTIGEWAFIGDYGLSTDEAVVMPRLKKGDKIHNKWPKYKGAKVNINNYIDRWEPNLIHGQLYNGIKNGVTEYVKLSQSSNNYKAVVSEINSDGEITSSSNTSDGKISSSYFDMLHMVSMDFHIARMLGLAEIDDNIEVNANTEYIYLAQYTTKKGLLWDFTSNDDLNHLFATTPIKKSLEKLPPKPSMQDIKYGLILNKGKKNEIVLTNEQGYTFDGKSRYVNLTIKNNDISIDDESDFFVPETEYSSVGETDSVFVGLDYRKNGEAKWSRNTITPDVRYKDTNSNAEVCVLPFTTDTDEFIFQHKVTDEGIHDYSAYTVNWFSRPSDHSNYLITDETKFEQPNTLLPPMNIRAQIIQPENPRILTTQFEQDLLEDINTEDKTLVRLTFEYNHAHDLTYQYADTVELFYRTDPPASVSGKIVSMIVSEKTNTTKIFTGKYSYYDLYKNAITLDPVINVNDVSKYIGGALTIKNQTFIIESIEQPESIDNGVTFIVRNNESTKLINTNDDLTATPTYITVPTFIAPDEKFIDEAFTAIENMSEVSNWNYNSNSPNKLTCTIQIKGNDWIEKEETYIDSGVEKKQKIRGIWDDHASIKVLTSDNFEHNIVDQNNLIIKEVTKDNIGVYEVVLNSKIFQPHPQSGASNPVFWYKGLLRVNKQSDIYGAKKTLEVLNILSNENEKIRLLVFDPSYNEDPIVTGDNITVNFYPGYKVYLYADTIANFTKTSTIPLTGTNFKTTYLGLRTKDSSSTDSSNYKYSKISMPIAITALEITEPLAPEKPMGGIFATRPDFYNKATYSFKVQFNQNGETNREPFAVAFYRASERMILEALYETETINHIYEALAALGTDKNFTSRWQSLVSFDFPNDAFEQFPTIDGYAFPNPDKQTDLYNNPLFTYTPVTIEGKKMLLAKIKEVIYNAFLPLTEQPLLYKYIKGADYIPQNKKPYIRDAAGDLLDPADLKFDQAPMAKKTGGENAEILFTDFTLDGSASNFYFYCGIELSNRMQFSDFGKIAGPVLLVNTTAPEPPKIKKVTSQISDDFNEIQSAVIIDVANYNSIQNITKFQLYRTSSPMDAISIRSMKMVKEFELVEKEHFDADTLSISDDFEEDDFIPYGDPLFYKVIALRKIAYGSETDATPVEDFVPSQPSKTVLANVVDNKYPIAPTIYFSSDIDPNNPNIHTNCTLKWNKVTHNAKYYVYKMSNSGNWVLLQTIKSNDLEVIYNLPDSLSKVVDDEVIYHRFKVDVENSSGMFNREENTKTI